MNTPPAGKWWVPRNYQSLALEFLSERPRANLYAEMGLGKTATMLHHIRSFGWRDVLIVAPKRVCEEVWPQEAQKWELFRGLEVASITGDEAERMAHALSLPRIACMNYESVDWLVDYLGENWPFTTVIADESTRLQGLRMRKGSKRAAALASVAFQKVERWYNLSGLPAPNGLGSLWGPQWYIDAGEALGRSFGAFEQRWFYRDVTARSPYADKKPFPHAQKEIEQRIRPKTLALRTEDWFDVAAPIENVIEVELPESAREKYRTMERQFYAEVEGGTVIASNAAVKSGKLLQLASGAVYHSKDQWSWVHDAKIEALRSIVTETGANLLVVYQYVSEAERIEKAFPQAVDIRQRKAIERWNDGEIPMLLAHPKSAGHGLNLQFGGHHIVFFSPTWDLELYAQVLERIGPVRQLQAGFNRAVFVHHILSRQTIDRVVKLRRESKAGIMELLLQAMANDRGG